MFSTKHAQLMFQPIATLINTFALEFDKKKELKLPKAEDFNLFLKAQSLNNKALKFVNQDEQLLFKELSYEQRIYLHGLIATRENNWHDLFNALIWLQFPQIKSALNAIHYQESSMQAGSVRSARRDLLTLFDECGVIVQADENIHQLIIEHEWHDLFIANKQRWESGEILITTFGHAMYEKYLNPYIGMTAKAFLLPRDNLNIDEKMAKNLLTGDMLVTKNELSPLPVLGIPGWHKQQDERFYANQNYFRK